MSYRVTITHTDSERFGEQELLRADTWADVTAILDNASTWAFDNGFVRIEKTAPAPATECECLPGAVCAVCAARGYKNGLAGYAARIYPEPVTRDDIEVQERAEEDAPEYNSPEEDEYFDSLETFYIDGPGFYAQDDMDFVDAQFFDHEH